MLRLQVFMGNCRQTQDKVALKKIRMDTEKEGFPITAIREIKILSTLENENIVNLREIVRSDSESPCYRSLWARASSPREQSVCSKTVTPALVVELA